MHVFQMFQLNDYYRMIELYQFLNVIKSIEISQTKFNK